MINANKVQQGATPRRFLTTATLTSYDRYDRLVGHLIHDDETNITYWVESTTDGTYANTVLEPVGSNESGPYLDARTDGVTLTANRCHVVDNQSALLPANPVFGTWVKAYNTAQIQDVANSRSNISGNGNDFEEGTGHPLALTSPIVPIPPDAEFTFIFDGTNWVIQSDILRSVHLEDNHDGLILRGGVEYTITNFTAGTTLRLSSVPAGVIKVRLGAGSTEPVTIEQFDAPNPVGQLRLETFVVTDSFVLPLSNALEQVSIDGATALNRWLIYRPWVIRESLSPVLSWQPSTDYNAFDQVVATSTADGIRYIYERTPLLPTDTEGTPAGTSGTTFDVAEESGWTQIGVDSTETLPILNTITLTTTGRASSSTRANNLYFVDGAGNDYGQGDFRVLSDTLGPGTVGSDLIGLNINPPVNGTRTVVFEYIGQTVRRGASALRVTLQNINNSTRVGVATFRYFDGTTDTFFGGYAGGDHTYVFNDFDFLTSPVSTTSDSLAALTDTDLTTVPPADCQALIFNAATGNWVPSPGIPELYMGRVATFGDALATANLKPAMSFWVDNETNPDGGPPGAFRKVLEVVASVATWSGPYGYIVAGSFDSTTVTMDSQTLTWDSTL